MPLPLTPELAKLICIPVRTKIYSIAVLGSIRCRSLKAVCLPPITAANPVIGWPDEHCGGLGGRQP